MLPNNALSTTPIPSAFMAPDDSTRNLLVDWEMGGIALNDPSMGLKVRTWKAWYDGVSMWVAPRSDLGSAVAVITASDITEISLAFDQNMHVTIAYMQSGVMKLYWYDTSIPGPTTSTFTGTSPFLCMDDKRDTSSSTNDILFFYVNGGNLCYRQQRDRFLTEYPLIAVSPGRIQAVGMNVGYRLQIRYRPV